MDTNLPVSFTSEPLSQAKAGRVKSKVSEIGTLPL